VPDGQLCSASSGTSKSSASVGVLGHSFSNSERWLNCLRGILDGDGLSSTRDAWRLFAVDHMWPDRCQF
jgi:hypothetical protein